jgi:hypothetical protein
MSPKATLLALPLLLGACATTGKPPLTAVASSPMELRQAQTRTFEGTDARLVLKAALDALQDEGYVIREANADLGIVTAVMEWRSREPNRGLRVLKWVTVLPTYGASLLLPSGRTEFSTVEAIVNVTPETTGSRVRISLVAKVTEEKGAVRSVSPVLDPVAYQALLARLDKALYLQREGF